MFEDFFDQIDKELGPLHPCWFEELTARAFRDEEGDPDIYKNEEEENPVKAPRPSALCSQLFSTPKIFQQHFQSPDSVPNEDSPHEVTSALVAFPWTDSSPCLFGSAKDKSCAPPGDCSDLLDTPKRSLAHSAKQISKSLGAQINPDLSWTSSLNTPSTLTPTVILPKTEDRPFSTSCLRDKEAIFVRKLFPSLSRGSESTAVKTTSKQDGIDQIESIQTDGLERKTVCSADVSLDASGLWKQTVPTAIEDGEVRSTVQSVLDGAEDVLSIFFSNRTSALRRVKSKERNRNKNDSSKDVNSSSELDKEPEETLKEDVDETHTVDVELKSPLRNKEVMQWTPLSLSESSLKEGFSSGLPSMNGHNPVGSNVPQGGAVYSGAADCNQSFLSSGERLRSSPDTYADGSRCQKLLLDKSPAFTLTRKSRKFVYRIPRSDVPKTGNKHKAASPVCLDQTVTESPSEETVSADCNKSRFVSDESAHDQTHQQPHERFSAQLHDLDEGLDMTQLSKAFAEDFTQELTSVGLVRSDQNDLVSSAVTTGIQKTSHKSEQKEEDPSARGDSSALAEVSVSCLNESTVLSAFEVSRDSGCPTTFSDLEGTLNSKDTFSGFKIASNRTISIPNEAIMKAKALLHEGIGESLISTIQDVTPQRNPKTETTRSSLAQSDLPKPALRTCLSHVQPSSEMLSFRSFKQTVSSCFSPQSNESDYKTVSKRSIPVSDVGPQKAKTLLEDNLEKDSDSSTQIHQRLAFRRDAERQAVLDNNSPRKSRVDANRGDAEENCPLTASQKADVTELCNLLEESDSQYEFTQFKPSVGSSSHIEREWDPEILNGIDFDDSFNSDVVKVATNAPALNHSVDKLCSSSKETRDGIVPLWMTEDNLVDEINRFGNKNQSRSFGFKTAKGKVISISETSLNKARHFFDELDKNASPNDKGSKADTEVPKPEQSRERSSAASSSSHCMDEEHVTHLELNQDVNAAPKNLEVNEKVSGTKQNLLDRKDVVSLNSDSHLGFSTARGKKLKVSQTALLRARKLLNDVDNFEASETQERMVHTSGRHVDSMSTTTLRETKAVSWRETAVNINQSGTETINQTSDDADVSLSERQNSFQEQKSGNNVEGMFTNICPSKTCQPLSVCGYGFQTASGKGVFVSAEALEKSTMIFKDCDETIDCLATATIVDKNDKLDVEILKQTNGFTTTSGTFSEVVLKETKDVYRASDLINGLYDMANERNDSCMEQRQGNGVHYREKPSLDQQPPREVRCKQKEQNKGLQSLFSVDPSEMVSPNVNCGFSTASGKKVSVSAEALQKAKHVLCDSADVLSCTDGPRKTKWIVETQPDTSSPGNCEGFSTAGGKMVAISAAALQKARNLFKDCEEESLASKDLQHQSCRAFSTASGKDGQHKGSCGKNSPKSEMTIESGALGEHKGFCTAGGKKVAISSAALQRAKCLFKDCEDNDLTSEDLQHQSCGGFSTANGKHVIVSEKALTEEREANTGLVESSSRHEPEINSGVQSRQQERSCGKSVPSEMDNASDNPRAFCTAGGKKMVAISASALQRAKSLFKDCEEEHFALEEQSETVPPETGSSHARGVEIGDENVRFDQLNKKNDGFSTASGKGVSISKVALEEATKLFRDCDVHQVTDTDNQPLESKSSKKRAAQLDLRCLDFNSCTDTQQLYFEQEAMACTKALLADDDLNDPPTLVPEASAHYKLSPSVRDLHTRETVEHNRKRKRELDAISVADSCQPPLKRQLLSEFDETVGCAKPLKNHPDGTPRDRRVFRYAHLQSDAMPPNRNSVDHKSTDREQRCAATASFQTRRQSVFVPPFQKSKKSETSNGPDASEVSSGFIPPLRKENKDNACESKPQSGSSTALENKMTNSTPDTHNVAQYCHEKNQHVDPKPEATVSVALKNLDSDKRDTETWREVLQLARDMQDMRLRKKKRQTVRPLPGSVYRAKTSGVSRTGLRDAVGHRCPDQHTLEELHQHGVHHKISQITSENAESFRFDCHDFSKHDLLMQSGAVQLADGGWLVPDSEGTVGKEELCRALYDTPGVDPKLISDAWVFNHYRWIVWKRASMERAFPDLMGGQCLTPEQVLLQLKLRYDVEVDHSQRSSLRRIMERDDTPAKTLVLCVCGVAKPPQHPEKAVKTDDRTSDVRMESAVIWLTDGWYAIKGLLDLPLSAMLHKGRLRVGDKVVISGAELVGSQEACPPLEAPESLMLKISANSTRRARWDTKLGYCRDPRPFRVPLSSLFAAGGIVSCVDILVLRSYHTQWMEKKPNGVFIFRNDRAEDREVRKHSSSKHKTVELLIANIQTQLEKETEDQRKSRRRMFSRSEIEALQDGEELYEAMECDPVVETHLSERQLEAVSKFRCSLVEKRQAELHERVQKAMKEAQEAEGRCPDREVTPVWKLSVVDAKDLQSNSVYTLNIWRPSADLYSLLIEGHRYRAYHLITSEGKKRSGLAHIQLTATKKTQFQDIEVASEWLHQRFRARECVSFQDLQNPQFSAPCGEVDIVGCIVSVVDRQGHCPVLHLVDEKFDLISVRTSSSLEQLAVEELLKPQALVAVSNLQLRQCSRPVPCLYAGEQAVFSINPKESHLQEAMVHLRSFVQTCEEFFSIAEEKVSCLFSSGLSGSFQPSRTPAVSNPKVNGEVTPQQKDRVFSPFTPVNKRTPVSTSNSEAKDPKNLKRKRGAVYLSRIPSPPPLTPLKTKASPSVNKTFNPPRRSATPKPPEKKPDSPRASNPPPAEEEWVRDEELVMIDTQALLDGLKEG